MQSERLEIVQRWRCTVVMLSSMASIIGSIACHCSCAGTRSSKTLMEDDTPNLRVECIPSLQVPSLSDSLSLEKAVNFRVLGVLSYGSINVGRAIRKTNRDDLSFSGSETCLRMSVVVPNLSRLPLIVISLSLTNGCIRSLLLCTGVFMC